MEIENEIIATEKFAASDLSGLREDLLQSGLDSRQVVELIRGFLAERGYGVSHDDATKVATSAAIFYGPLHRMQETLEQLAVSM
jgi:aryl carrier-like protein